MKKDIEHLALQDPTVQRCLDAYRSPNSGIKWEECLIMMVKYLVEDKQAQARIFAVKDMQREVKFGPQAEPPTGNYNEQIEKAKRNLESAPAWLFNPSEK
jgi:hypothetical protein